jgi:hypothetical protein
MRSSSRAWPPGSGRSPALAKAAAIGAAILLLSSCSSKQRPVVALDEAYAATRPALAALLQDDRGWGSGLFASVGGPIVVPIALAQSPGIALDAAVAESKRCGLETPLVASPLVAKATLEGGAWSGEPPLFVPDWRGREPSGLWGFTTDPVPAYRAAGSAAGAYIAALAKAGGAPSCGIIYEESPARPRGALDAFAGAFAERSEGGILNIRELRKDDEGPAVSGATRDPAADQKAEAAVAELLGRDVRVLFVALGAEAGAAIRAAARPGLAIGADFPYPESPPALAFRIVPNDRAILKNMISSIEALRGGSRGGKIELIPAVLVPEARAGSFRTGKTTLKSLVEESALYVKDSRQSH